MPENLRNQRYCEHCITNVVGLSFIFRAFLEFGMIGNVFRLMVCTCLLMLSIYAIENGLPGV